MHCLHREVAVFVATLPYDQRTALLLRRTHHLGYAEIAAKLRLPEHEVRAGVYDAMHALRIHLGDRLCVEQTKAPALKNGETSERKLAEQDGSP